jgi:hypothetical protein
MESDLKVCLYVMVLLLCRRPAAEGVPARVYDHLDPGRSSSKHNQKHSGEGRLLPIVFQG